MTPFPYRMNASIIISAVYDLPPIQSLNDPVNALMENFVDLILQDLVPTSHLVNMFPALDYLPQSMAKWRRDAQSNFQRLTSRFEELFLAAKERTVST
jgi:hypothetical protein